MSTRKTVIKEAFINDEIFKGTTWEVIENIKKLHEQFPEALSINLNVESDNGYYEAKVLWDRYETDDEMAKRIVREDKAKERKDLKEHKAYLKAKAEVDEYEGK